MALNRSGGYSDLPAPMLSTVQRVEAAHVVLVTLQRVAQGWEGGWSSSDKQSAGVGRWQLGWPRGHSTTPMEGWVEDICTKCQIATPSSTGNGVQARR